MDLVRLGISWMLGGFVPSLSQGTISPVSFLQRIPTLPQRPGKLPCELLATAAVQISYSLTIVNIGILRHSG
jgi:hypothetical protein